MFKLKFWKNKDQKQDQLQTGPLSNYDLAGLPVWVSLDHQGKPKEPNAMVVVEKIRMRVFRNIPFSDVPVDSYEKKYRGKWLHVLRLDLDNKLHAITRPTPVAGRTPIDLFMARNCAEEVQVVFGLSVPFNAKVGIGMAVGMGIAILIAIFLISAVTAAPPTAMTAMACYI